MWIDLFDQSNSIGLGPVTMVGREGGRGWGGWVEGEGGGGGEWVEGREGVGVGG